MADQNNVHDDLPPWEPCDQCQQVKGKEGIVEYSGAEDGTYLCCSSCKCYVHPTCDKISDPNGIFRYFCQKCRSSYNKKIAWKRKKPDRKNSLNQPIDSPLPESTSTPQNESSQQPQKTNENDKIKDNNKKVEENNENIQIEDNNESQKIEDSNENEKSTPEKEINTGEKDIELYQPPPTQNDPESAKMATSTDIEECSQQYDYLMDKIPSYQPPKTPLESPEKETEVSSNVTIEEVRDALVNLIESQPESLRKHTKMQLNLNPDITLTKSQKIPQPEFSPAKQTTSTPTKQSNENTVTSPKINSPESVPAHTSPGTQPTQHPPIQCYPPNLEATMFTNIKPVMSTSTKSQPLQHRTKHEIIARYEKKEQEYNQLYNKFDEQAKKLKEMEEFKIKYEITIDALTVTTKDDMTPEERVTSLQKEIVLNKEKIHKLEKKNEELKKENANKQVEIRKAKEITKTNMQAIHELQAYKETATGQIARLDELSKMKSDQITSLEGLMGAQDVKIHNLNREHSQKLREIEENHRATTLAMAFEIQKQKEEKTKIEKELDKIANDIIGKKPNQSVDEIEVIEQNKDEERNEPKATCLYFRLGLCKNSNCQMKHSNGIELSPKKSNPQAKVTTENKENKICIHHRLGKCRRGEKCPFKHENKEAKKECIYYRRGHCSRGKECKYLHKAEETNSNGNHNNERSQTPESVPVSRYELNQGRCKDFDRGFCRKRSSCSFKHCRDRVTEEISNRQEERSTQIHPSNDTQTSTRNSRCADFDKGYCPRRSRCQLNHMKDRNQRESADENR